MTCLGIVICGKVNYEIRNKIENNDLTDVTDYFLKKNIFFPYFSENEETQYEILHNAWKNFKYF